MTTINSKTTPLSQVLVGVTREAWRKRPLVSLLFVMAFITSLVFWTQVTGLAWFGQILLVLVTITLAFAAGSVLTRAWLEFRLKDRLASLGADGSVHRFKSMQSLHLELADEIHRLTEQQEFLLNGYEQEKRRLLSVESCINGFVVELTVNPQGQVSVDTVDTSVERFFPMSRADFMADWTSMLKFVDSKFHSAFKTILTRPEAFPVRESLVFSTYRRIGGEPQYFQLTLQRQAKPGGIGMYAVFLDVGDLVLAKELAESADKAKSEFLATISHELRTPLNAIIGFSRLLEEQLTEPQLQGDVRNISSSATSLHLILSDVLEYSRIQANGLKLDLSPFDLDALVKQVHALNLNLAIKKSIEFSVVSDSEGPCLLMGDANRLRQVVQNLVSNALKFTEQGYVKMRLLTAPPVHGRVEVFLEVADSGIGIGPIAMQRLFQRFSQANREINRQYGGTGLGLAICKGLVELMGGRIDVSSEPGVGSVFTVSLNLPVAQKLAPVKHVQPVEPVATALNILVVDDHSMNIKLLDRYLSKRGHNVAQATGGLDAVRQCEESCFDLVLMDIDMPDLDGHEATRRIRASASSASRNSFICALSGLSDDKSIGHSAEAGMNLHLTKPVPFDKLDKLLEDLAQKLAVEKV